MKEGSDADRYRVSTSVTATSVAYLVSRPKPSSYPNNNRLVPYEPGSTAPILDGP